MLVPFLIMLREGIEAALIVGIVASYLHRSGKQAWMPAVWTGVVAAGFACLGIGIALELTRAEFPQRQQEMFEALVGLVAVGLLTSMVFWMKRAARSIKAELHHSIDAALRSGRRQGAALVGMAFFAVAREGLEAVFFLLATFQQSVGPGAPVGAFLGLMLAVLVGYGIYSGGVRLDLRRFFFWTGIFILFVAAGLLASSLRHLHEAGLWNGLQGIAFDLSHVLPVDSVPGTVLAGLLGYNDTPTFGEVALYALFLLVALPAFLFRAPGRPAVARTA